MARTKPRSDLPPTQPDEKRNRLYLGFYIEPQDEAPLDALIGITGKSKSEIGREALRDYIARSQNKTAQAVLDVLNEFVRAGAANSADGNFLDDPKGYTAIGEMIEFLKKLPRPPGVAPDLPIPTPHRRAERIMWALADPVSQEFASPWMARVAAGFGSAVMARLAEQHAAELARLEAMENRSASAPDPAVQSSWGDAITAVKDEGTAGQIETIRRQIASLAQMPAAERVSKIEFMRSAITRMTGVTKAVRQELLSLLKAASDQQAQPIRDDD